jgi:uncharacterized protein (TIGR02598 family)
MKQRSWSAFSLIELTLALGVAAFCLLAVFGLMPIGVQTNRNATSQTAATNIIALVVADLRATPKTALNSQLFCVTFGTPRPLFFDSQGQCSADLAGLIPCSCIAGNVTLQTRYRVNVTFPPSTGSLTYANVKVTWPAAVDPTTTTPTGSVEMFAALDRN